MVYYQLNPKEHISINAIWHYEVFIQENAHADLVWKIAISI